MVKKRITKIEEIERLAENIYNKYGKHIRDRDSFNRYYAKFFDGDVSDAQDDVRDNTFNIVAGQHPDVRFETKEFEPEPVVRRGRQREYLGLVKGRTSYVSKEIIKVRGKQQVRYRDQYGRFAKRKV